jgi:hypothetical protein
MKDDLLKKMGIVLELELCSLGLRRANDRFDGEG